MRQIPGHPLWLGHIGDARDLPRVMSTGIEALVDLAANEPVLNVPRDLVYCRFPLVDGAGNPPWLLQVVIDTVTRLLAADVPTLVYCSAGMSRSPAIAAAALAVLLRCQLSESLALVAGESGGDVSPVMLMEIQQLLDAVPN